MEETKRSRATHLFPPYLCTVIISCIVISIAWNKPQLMLGFRLVRSAYCRGASSPVFKKSGQNCFKTKLQVRRATSTLGGSQEKPTLATQDWLGDHPDPALPLLRAKPGQVPKLCIFPPRPHQTKPPTYTGAKWRQLTPVT